MNGEREHREEDGLSVPEKILKVQDLWDEIAGSPQGVAITAEQRAEAERRLREHDAAPGQYSTWEEVKRRLDGELG